MELQALTPELPQLLREIGVKYDPDRLAEVLSTRQLEVSGRAIRVATVLGGFVGSLLQASAHTLGAGCGDSDVRRILRSGKKNPPGSDETVSTTVTEGALPNRCCELSVLIHNSSWGYVLQRANRRTAIG